MRPVVHFLYVATAVVVALGVVCAYAPLSVELLPGRYAIESLRRQARYPYNRHPEIIRYGTYSNRSIDGWVVDCSLGGPFIVSETFAFCTDDFGLTVTGFDPAKDWSISNIDITVGPFLDSQGEPDGTPPQAKPK